MRKLLLTLALAASLVTPAGVFAANVTGTVTESIDNAATVSATIPTSLTYAFVSGTTWKAPFSITGLATNNPTGLKVSSTFSAFTGSPSGTIAVTNRSMVKLTQGGGLSPSDVSGFSAGGVTTTSQVWTYVNVSSAVIGPAFFNMDSTVASVGIAAYTGSMAVTVATNP